MFDRIRDWWHHRKDWHEAWQENWKGYTEPTEDGLSKFQHAALEIISGNCEVSFERIQYEGMIGLEGFLPGTERRLCVYNDTVTLTKGRSFNRYDLWEFNGYLSPAEFIAEFREDFKKCSSA